jgi:hypothetical protein
MSGLTIHGTSNNYGPWEIHMMYRSDSGVFPPPLADATGEGRPGTRTPGHGSGHASPANARRINSAADIAGRAVASAEAVQARLFEAILLVELVHLQDLAKSMLPHGTWGGDPRHQPYKTLTEVGVRIEEVHRLLGALRDRFPHGPMVEGPSEGGLNPPGDRTQPASRQAVQDCPLRRTGGRRIVFPMAAGQHAVP